MQSKKAKIYLKKGKRIKSISASMANIWILKGFEKI